MSRKFECNYNVVEIDDGFDKAISLSITRGHDDTGYVILRRDQEAVVMELDNHQAFQLAIEILKRVDVCDTRG